METVEYLEEYVKRVLKIPYCNFEGVHPDIAYEIIVGLSLMYEMYPFFNRVICAVEQSNDMNYHVNLLEYTDNTVKDNDKQYYEDEEKMYGTFSLMKCTNNDSDNYKLPMLINKNFCDYFSLELYENLKNYKRGLYSNIIEQPYGRLGIYHEFGHLLDTFLHISNSDELSKIIEGHDIQNEISEYATCDNYELTAEAFAYYIFSQKRLTLLEKKLGRNDFDENDYKATPLVQEIGKLIDRRYKKFTKFRQIKFISERYNFNKRFTINKKFKPISIEKMEEEIKRI